MTEIMSGLHIFGCIKMIYFNKNAISYFHISNRKEFFFIFALQNRPRSSIE